MQRTTSNISQKQADSILKSALIRAVVVDNSSLKCYNRAWWNDPYKELVVATRCARAKSLMQQNLDRVFNVFQLILERQDLPTKDIKTIRVLCKTWKEIIDGSMSSCNSILQQRFVTRLYTVQQMAFMMCIYPSVKENSQLVNNLLIEKKNILCHVFQYLPVGYIRQVCKQFKEIIDCMLGSNSNGIVYQGSRETRLKWESYAELKFALDRDLKININLENSNYILFLIDLINVKSPCLGKIGSISFGNVSENMLLVQNLLDSIFDNEEVLFPSCKKLIFGNIQWGLKSEIGRLTIPGFKRLETLIFGDIFILIYLKCCPLLKRLKYNFATGTDLPKVKKIVDLRKMTFEADCNSPSEFFRFFDSPDNTSWSGCIEAFVINKIGDSQIKYVQGLIDRIHSKQELFPNLKKIILEGSASEADILKVLVLPKFAESIEVVFCSKVMQSAVVNPRNWIGFFGEL